MIPVFTLFTFIIAEKRDLEMSLSMSSMSIVNSLNFPVILVSPLEMGTEN